MGSLRTRIMAAVMDIILQRAHPGYQPRSLLWTCSRSVARTSYLCLVLRQTRPPRWTGQAPLTLARGYSSLGCRTGRRLDTHASLLVMYLSAFLPTSPLAPVLCLVLRFVLGPRFKPSLLPILRIGIYSSRVLYPVYSLYAPPSGSTCIYHKTAYYSPCLFRS